ncbi:MAG TPA: TFIIB-type zinc ribbon-containing protein, partial [Candidatus Bilamarchaeaceae archaeon]|nr:TFIIB-type zinc ribbon-containing protein [Candidatus Bilamarchaeaceae archaeon]
MGVHVNISARAMRMKSRHNAQKAQRAASKSPQQNKCPECGAARLIRDYEKGELLCGQCGLIIAENIQDLGPEWRAFDAEQKGKRARGGAP